MSRALFYVSLAAVTGCSSMMDCIIGPQVDKVEESLNEAISALQNESANWQATLEKLVTDLRVQGRQDLAADVENLMARTVGTASVEIRCNVDFAGDRMAAFVGKMLAGKISNLRSRASGGSPEPLHDRPRTCNIAPQGTIDGARIADGSTRSIVWYGYNFFDLSPSDAKFSVELRDVAAGKRVADLTKHLSLNSTYMMDLPLVGLDKLLEPEKVYKILVSWSGVLYSEISVSGPARPPVVLPECFTSNRFSEEGDHTADCGSGYAIEGIRCRGDYCDDLQLTCCPYLAPPDSGSSIFEGRRFSEEGAGQDTTTAGFARQLSCSGRYCDDLKFTYFRSPKLGNTGNCHFTATFSEEGSGQAHCPKGEFVAGAKCTGRFCDNISLYCCSAAIH